MEDERVYLTADEAIRMLPDGDMIHTYRQGGGFVLIGGDMERCMICAVIDAESELAVWEGVGKMVGEYTERFCKEQPSGWQPGGRFPGEAKRTVIKL